MLGGYGFYNIAERTAARMAAAKGNHEKSRFAGVDEKLISANEGMPMSRIWESGIVSIRTIDAMRKRLSLRLISKLLMARTSMVLA